MDIPITKEEAALAIKMLQELQTKRQLDDEDYKAIAGNLYLGI